MKAISGKAFARPLEHDNGSHHVYGKEGTPLGFRFPYTDTAPSNWACNGIFGS